MRLKRFLQGFGGLAVLLTLFPFIAVDYWWIRIFDFPHFQLTVLTLIALLVYFIRFNMRKPSDYVFVGVLVACFGFQLSKIFPYTLLASFEVLNHTLESEDRPISLLTANVLAENQEDQEQEKAAEEKATDQSQPQ